MSNELVLRGCTPTPLASYLKALAVLRLIAEAGTDKGGDPDAAGFWRSDEFVLRTRLTEEQLRAFFLERYRPTPLIAPWNGGSGFFPKDNTQGIEALSKSLAPRFDDYRQAIGIAQSQVARFGLTESPKQGSKAAFLQSLRNIAPNALLRWMDAAVILSDDDPRYPPLLGTGGNDGRLDFTNNFMQRLADIFDMNSGSPRVGARETLDSGLFCIATDALSDRAIGQFSPGAAGGPNAVSGFEGAARINAWDFVLMLEGAVLFAASAVRRLESADPAILAAPFTVRSRAGTSGSASANDDDDARGEIWMPLWDAPCSLEELRCLLTEGRVVLNGRPTRDGLDFARAVAQLGVDRGVTGFQRYGFLMRSGKAFLATPLSRMKVCRNPDADLIAEVERRNWLASVQRYARDENSPNAFRAAAHRLDTALFAFTQQASRPATQAVLRQIGSIETALNASPKSQESVRIPVPSLSPPWAIRADDQSTEFRIAAAIAGLCLRNDKGRRVLHARRHLATVSETLNAEGDRAWEPTSRLAVWGPGPLTGNLAALLHRRRLEAITLGSEGQVLASQTGATRSDVAAFLDGDTDDARIGELLGGLACVEWNGAKPPSGDNEAVLPLAFTLLKVFFTPEPVLRALKWLPPDRALRLPAEIPARLAANDVQAAVKLAWHRLRVLGVKLPGREPPRVVVDEGLRWLAALCIPLSFPETRRLLRSLDLNPESELYPSPPSERIA
ncbi:MAG: type I-G CRISPR-associated protein Cas8g1/Csx17 [Gammaproteobacteria bacterium]